MNSLNQLIDEFGSDKNASEYTDVYIKFFGPIRTKITSVLEIGLGTIIPNAKSSMYDWKTIHNKNYQPGASLRVWKNYFPFAFIYGGDIQPDTQFEEERIKTFLFNSQNRLECNKTLKDLTFDIIIDDGDHDVSSQIKTIFNLIGRVNLGGYYIIEDVTPGNANILLSYISPLVQILNLETHILEPHQNLVVLKFN